MKKYALLVCVLTLGLLAKDNKPTVRLGSIEIRGTHLPSESVIRLLGLTVGQSVDYDMLSAACDHVLNTGLIADITFSYIPQPNSSDVAIVFKLWDETPLLPSRVFPKENEANVWSCLQEADPIFLKELPNTKDALGFYVANIDKCISDTSNQPLHAEARVICDQNQKPAKIEFRIVPGPSALTP